MGVISEDVMTGLLVTVPTSQVEVERLAPDKRQFWTGDTPPAMICSF